MNQNNNNNNNKKNRDISNNRLKPIKKSILNNNINKKTLLEESNNKINNSKENTIISTFNKTNSKDKLYYTPSRYNNPILNKKNPLEKKNTLKPIIENTYNPKKYQPKQKSLSELLNLDLKHYDEQLLMMKEDININLERNIMKSYELIKYLDEDRKKKDEEEKIEKQTDLLLSLLLDTSVKSYENKYTTTSGNIYEKNLYKSLYNDDSLFKYNDYNYNYLLKNGEEENKKKKEEEKLKIPKEKIDINVEINNISDLIKICNDYPLADNVEYNIDMESLHKIKPSLEKLNGLIGMHSIKETIVDQILYFIQNLHDVSPESGDYMHTVIYGPPGTGKTEVAKIMGVIFSNLGVLKKNVFRKVTRDDLVAGYLGQTAIKTKDVIKECLGGVLFIDEAYALGNTEKKDSFSKESIDTICEALSNHKHDLMCIIAGYKRELKDCFFSYNEGLESRFTWKFQIDDYNAQDLKEIFEKKVKDAKWSLKDDINVEWFDKNFEYFKFFGRDMETLLSKVKIAHSKRVFCKPKDEKTQLTMVDLDKGLDMYLNNDDVKNRKDKKEFDKMLQYTLYS
jgi:SpoVK/Ycf46/Vps4 family AAA+-type ATPase